jgi:CrcB protein
MLAYLWVAIGGAIGSVGRFWLSGLIDGRIGSSFPYGTLAINVSGSFLIGIFAAFADPDSRILAPPAARQFLMIGICGGYTTFSSFSLQTLRLAQDREWLYAGANVLLSVALCLIAVWLGYVLGSVINSMKGH